MMHKARWDGTKSIMPTVKDPSRKPLIPRKEADLYDI